MSAPDHGGVDGVKRGGGDEPASGPSKRPRTDVVVTPPAISSQYAASSTAPEEQPELQEPSGKTCRHEVGMPPGMEPDADMLALTVPPDIQPAREYKFELDPFQKAAVACIERDESVLVSAHTSAGKTVCAEYAIAKSLKAQQRVLYTSPIKALSNQKYRELKEEFGDVGLLTGDVTIDVDASCLVMTTEILRSMLYRGSEVMREVKWVVFDEVHYMRDKERGVVWEEVMILLPHSVRYVMLSATVPNALEFAAWIAQLHSQPCHVVYTGYRPTPLTHYIFPQGGQGMYQVVDESGTFKSEQFSKALAAIKPRAPREAGGGERDGGKGSKGKGRGGKGQEQGPSDCFKLVQLIVGKGYDPLIVFAFGKAKVETLAAQMTSLHLNSAEESAMVETIFKNAVDTLSDDDQALPQVNALLPMVMRGVAVHHSGLLPVLKELVEILFSENLVKLLFATETFAMGLNMPARTVLFAQLNKFDGSGFRYLSSGEYIQMSGRAGRRGLDTRGVVVQMVDERTDSAKLREMLTGKADTLSSKFHLSYNMLLNCVRVETADVEMIIQKSFYTFQQQAALPQLQARQKALLARLASPELSLTDLEAATELHATLYSEAVLQDELRDVLTLPVHVLPFLQAGRLARVRLPVPSSSSGGGGPLGTDWGVGIIVTFKKDGTEMSAAEAAAKSAKQAKKDRKNGNSSGPVGGTVEQYTVDVLLRCAPGTEERVKNGRDAIPSAAVGVSPSSEVDEEAHVLTVPLAHIDRLSSVRVKMPADIRGADARFGLLKVLREIGVRFPSGVPLLDPTEDMKIAEEGVRKTLRKLETVQSKLAEERLSDPQLHAQLPVLRARFGVAADERALRKQIKEVEAILMRDELQGMRQVLRTLGHLSEEGVIQNKGRVACEVSTADELLTSELVFSGLFNELEAGCLAALCSCLVCEHGGSKQSNSGGSKSGAKSPGGSGAAGAGAGASRSTGGKGGADDVSNTIRTRSMKEPFERLRETAHRVGSVVEEARLPIDVQAYVDQFSPELVDVVIEWCKGTKFVDIVQMSDWYEGSIIRAFHRLEELLRQLSDAAKVVGNEELEARCAESRGLLIRDVVFAGSLYT